MSCAKAPVPYLSARNTRSQPEAGAEERLSPSGDNLPNVIQHRQEQHAQRLAPIFGVLRRRLPKLQRFTPEITEPPPGLPSAILKAGAAPLNKKGGRLAFLPLFLFSSSTS